MTADHKMTSQANKPSHVTSDVTGMSRRDDLTTRSEDLNRCPMNESPGLTRSVSVITMSSDGLTGRRPMNDVTSGNGRLTRAICTPAGIERLCRRLMERSGVEPKRGKMAYWGSKDGDGLDIGQTEYITRLTALRDSLADQEQVYLAQALDRLRLHSLAHKHSNYRLRMSNDDTSRSEPTTTRRGGNTMLTTVERFRQMRPKPHHPSVFPLQGKQLIEPQSRSSSAEEYDDLPIHRSMGRLPSKVDDTVSNNLQRLLQPSSSIPNIGRKSLKQQENLAPKTKSLLQKRPRLPKPTPHGHLLSPSFRSNKLSLGGLTEYNATGTSGSYNTNTSSVNSSTNNTINSSSVPDTPKRRPVDQHFRHVDYDSMQTFCYDYYLKDELPPNGHVTERLLKGKRPAQLRNLGSVDHLKSFSTDGYNSEGNVVAERFVTISNPSRPNTNPNTQQGTLSEDDSHTEVSVVRLPNLGGILMDDYGEFQSDDVDTSIMNSVRREQIRNGHAHYGHALLEKSESVISSENGLRCPDKSKKQIVVDMPSIVFNTASPENGIMTPYNTEDYPTRPHSNRVIDIHKGITEASLRKNIKQQELRKRELEHLLEDVVELSLRTEVLSARPTRED